MYGFETFILHSREVHNFIGITFKVGIIVFHFSVIMDSFKKAVSDFGHFPHLYVEKIIALTQHVNIHANTQS